MLIRRAVDVAHTRARPCDHIHSFFSIVTASVNDTPKRGQFCSYGSGIAAQLDNAQCRSIALPLARYETFRSMEQSKHHPEGGNRAALRPLAARPRGDWWCEDEISPVLKALRLLAYIAHSGEPVALSEITRALGLPKPTSHRLAGMLERARFVQKDPLTSR